MNIDSIFVQWNKATVQSLFDQIKLQKDSSVRALYKNRIEAFKALNGLGDSLDEIVPNSIRYQFLSHSKDLLGKSDAFYIVEANELGEQAEIKNYVICLTSNVAHVYDSKFVNGQWIISADLREIEFDIKDSLSNYLTEFGGGFNNDDIIITEVKNFEVIDSKYFLFTTLVNSNNFGDLLSIEQ